MQKHKYHKQNFDETNLKRMEFQDYILEKPICDFL